RPSRRRRPCSTRRRVACSWPCPVSLVSPGRKSACTRSAIEAAGWGEIIHLGRPRTSSRDDSQGRPRLASCRACPGGWGSPPRTLSCDSCVKGSLRESERTSGARRWPRLPARTFSRLTCPSHHYGTRRRVASLQLPARNCMKEDLFLSLEQT